jgi:hypothetical protein
VGRGLKSIWLLHTRHTHTHKIHIYIHIILFTNITFLERYLSPYCVHYYLCFTPTPAPLVKFYHFQLYLCGSIYLSFYVCVCDVYTTLAAWALYSNKSID